MNRDTIDALVRDAVEACPPPESFSAMDPQLREHHELQRQRAGLSEAEYLSRFVTAESMAENDEAAEIARQARGR